MQMLIITRNNDASAVWRGELDDRHHASGFIGSYTIVAETTLAFQPIHVIGEGRQFAQAAFNCILSRDT